jgi:DNA-directed RNA polymerase specialized sigma24 family protein
MSRTVLSEHLDRRGRDEELADLVAARQAALLRTAYLLTGDPVSSRELVTDSLGRLHLSWDRVRSEEGADAFLRRVMFRSSTSWRRRFSGSGSAGQGDGSDLWRAISSLPARQRALVVLSHYEGLSVSEAAGVLGIGERRARSLAAKARSGLGMEPTP